MDRVVLSTPQLLGLGCLLLAVGAWLATGVGRTRARWRGRLHNLRGQRGERAAERLLLRAGYTPIARHARGSYTVEVGAELHEVSLQADYLVERLGLRMVAEVKTGRHAPRFEHAETRRQLLEYQLAFDVSCVVLVDVEAGQLREVRFPVPAAGQDPSSGWLGWLLAAGLGAALVYGLAHP